MAARSGVSKSTLLARKPGVSTFAMLSAMTLWRTARPSSAGDHGPDGIGHARDTSASERDVGDAGPSARGEQSVLALSFGAWPGA